MRLGRRIMTVRRSRFICFGKIGRKFDRDVATAGGGGFVQRWGHGMGLFFGLHDDTRTVRFELSVPRYRRISCL